MSARSRSPEDVEQWLVRHLTGVLDLDASALGPETDLLDLGLDSVEAVGMAGELEEWLGLRVSPTVVWEHRTIVRLAQHLAGATGRIADVIPDSPRMGEGAPKPAPPPAAAQGQRASAERHDLPNGRPLMGDPLPAPIAPLPAADRGVSVEEASDHPFATFVNPPLGRLLGQLRLDKRFVRASGCWLEDDRGQRYLDFIAAYGALPFGHNPPAIWDALLDVRQRGEPSFIQPSYLEAAGALARRLVDMAPAGLRYVAFANSGTEAIEAAIKMCRAATQRLGILSTHNSFHGKTLGALSATGNAGYQQRFGAPATDFDSIPFGDVEALAAALARRPGYYAAFLIEPIQGEGGIVEAPRGYLTAARALCDQAGVLLAFDEIQTGLGRTGRLFACEDEGVVPDVMALAKALGGGLVPIGACLAGERAYSDLFGLKHSSTFAGGGLACRVGLASLGHLLEEDGALIRQVAENGAFLKEGLIQMARRHPHLVAEVRGRGYMLGIRFAVHRQTWPSSLLALAAEQGGLTPLFASYLLNVEHLRLAPTLNGMDVVRIEPPLIATREECQLALASIERALDVFATGDAGRVLGGILDGTPRPRSARSTAVIAPLSISQVATQAERSESEEGRFAFLLHPLALRSYLDFDPTLASLADDEVEEAARCLHGLGSAAVAGEARILSSTGQVAMGQFIVVGHTAAELMDMPSTEAIAVVREAVEFARDSGASIVGLGAFTSIVTQGGLALTDVGIPLTSGNSYTVVTALEALGLALERWRPELTAPVCAVIGAGGAIGRAVALLLGERAARLCLVGNPRRSQAYNEARLMDIAGEICRHIVRLAEQGERPAGLLAARVLATPHLPDGDAPLAEFTSLAARLRQREGVFLIGPDAAQAASLADALVLATNATVPLTPPESFKPGAVVCDISRPRNIGPAVQAARPDVLVIDGGVVEIPGRPHIGCYGLAQGLAYACMAETMMLALERRYRHTSLGGDLSLDDVLLVRRLADKHGFRIASLRSFDRPLEQELSMPSGTARRSSAEPMAEGLG